MRAVRVKVMVPLGFHSASLGVVWILIAQLILAIDERRLVGCARPAHQLLLVLLFFHCFYLVGPGRVIRMQVRRDVVRIVQFEGLVVLAVIRVAPARLARAVAFTVVALGGRIVLILDRFYHLLVLLQLLAIQKRA